MATTRNGNPLPAWLMSDRYAPDASAITAAPGAHCQSCGEARPRTDDGYTTCCNELVCEGGGDGYIFGTHTMNVRACCWAKATLAGITEGWRHP